MGGSCSCILIWVIFCVEELGVDSGLVDGMRELRRLMESEDSLHRKTTQL